MSKGIFETVIKWSWDGGGGYPDYPEDSQCNHKYPYKEEAKRDLTESEGNGMTSAESECARMIWGCVGLYLFDCAGFYWPWKRNAVKVLVAHSYLTLCHPMDCSPPGSSVHGILKARILEWVAIPFSREPSWPRDQTQVSHICRQILYFMSH